MSKRIHTPESFKAELKVGDRVQGFTTGKIVTITAIGKTRFLAIDSMGDERVSKMSAPDAAWKKVENVDD